MTSITVRPLYDSPVPKAKPVAAKNTRSPWTWMVVTCLLLGISGGIRFWRAWQFQALSNAGAACPFPLNELPTSLGSWQAVEGSQTQLEPEVARVAGSSDHVIREYVNERGGEQVTTLVLYGLASTVFAHIPDYCYPGHGYRRVMGPEVRQLSIPGLATPVQCSWAIYSKKIGGIEQYDVVYCTFLHDGQWLPDLASRWKSFRYHPGTFKVQLQRAVSHLAPEDSPSEALLGELIRAITSRISPAHSE